MVIKKTKDYHKVTVTFLVGVEDWKADSGHVALCSKIIKDRVASGMEVPIEDVMVKIE